MEARMLLGFDMDAYESPLRFLAIFASIKALDNDHLSLAVCAWILLLNPLPDVGLLPRRRLCSRLKRLQDKSQL